MPGCIILAIFLALEYSVNSRLVKELKKEKESLIPQECLVYLEKDTKMKQLIERKILKRIQNLHSY